MKTLHELWQINSYALPFAAKSKFWGCDTYVVVLKIGAWQDPKKDHKIDLSSFPIGIPLTNDQPNNIYRDSTLFNENFVIPRSGSPDWTLIQGLDLNRFELKHIHSLDNYFQFGKYTGWLVKDVINRDPDYINWCLIHKEDFTIGEDCIEYLISNNIPDFNVNLCGIAVAKQETIALKYMKTSLINKNDQKKENEKAEPTIMVLQSKNWDKEDYSSLSIERTETFTSHFVNDKLPWSISDQVQLKNLLSNRFPVEEIARKLKRKESTIRKKMKSLGLKEENNKLI